jgi:penicillin-binding protein 1A
VLDEPIQFRDRVGHVWQPKNDDGKFDGPMRLREALVRSKNLVSVRLIDAIGVDFARKFITKFGFDESELPPNLSMALGSASLAPLSVARGYAVFANGGSLITPWFIDEVRDRDGKVIFKETPAVACSTCGGTAPSVMTAPVGNLVDGFDLGPTPSATPAPKPAPTTTPAPTPTATATPADANAKLAPRTVDERTVYQLVSMMRDVVLRGTGAAARVLNREDVGGKTGTSNDFRDAWFNGFGGHLATVVWVGRDDFKPLGSGEFGNRAALPIWIDYMRVALKDRPIMRNDPPAGMVQLTTNGVTEWVKAEDANRIQIENQNNAEEKAKQQEEDTFDIF